MNNLGDRIIVDFNFGFRIQTGGVEGSPQLNRNPRPSFRVEGARPDVRIHRRLSPLLRTLVEIPTFSQSNQILEIERQDEICVRDFFIPLPTVTPKHVSLYRGFWGMLSDSQFSQNGTLWFNSGGREDLSFCLDEKHVDDIYRRFSIENEEDFAGAYILVFGILYQSQNRKLYCVIDDTAFVALHIIR